MKHIDFVIALACTTLAASVSACSDTGERPRNDNDLPASVAARFDAMKGPLGCAQTESLTPDPPGGCEGASALIATAKHEYSSLAKAADSSGRPPDLAPALAAYEAAFASQHPFVEHRIARGEFTIVAREFGAEHAGTGPTLVLMHGFPDDQHLYDRVAPALGQTHRTITFDFVGWGRSTQPPADYAYTVEALRADLEAVIADFGPGAFVPVVHDASGWPGIDWALDNESRVSALVLLNTVYQPIAGLAPPYVIRALSAFDLRPQFLEALGSEELMNRALFRAQVGQFFVTDQKSVFLPVLEASIPLDGLLGLTATIRDVSLARMNSVPRMQAFAKPVSVAFGAQDPFLNESVARAFAATFPRSKLELVPSAGHYVQLDQPEAVVAAIRAAASEQ